MLTPPKTTGPGRRVRFVTRKQKRNPRRLLESVPEDWARWERACKLQGLNWSEFTRRALNQAAAITFLEYGTKTKKVRP